MKITNNFGLPEAILRACKFDPYQMKGDISVTRLISPPRKVALEKLHFEDLEEDCADRFWALIGKTVHSLLETYTTEGRAEFRLSIRRHGWDITGQTDLYNPDTAVLTDYKVTTCFGIREGPKEEWGQQLNLLAHILRENGHPVKILKTVVLLRDWSKTEALRDDEYPERPILDFTLPLLESEECENYLDDRVRAHQSAQLSGKLPECSVSERWQRASTWALWKKGGKRASKVLFDESSAAMAFEEIGGAAKGYFIESRPGKSVRCENFCTAAMFCEQWQKIQEQTKKEKNDVPEN